MDENNHFSDDQDDYAVINGCKICLKYNSNESVILSNSEHNKINTVLHDRVIGIVSITYTDSESLYIMLEALSRFAVLIKARGIISSPDLHMDTIEILDQYGILDRWYGQQ